MTDPARSTAQIVLSLRHWTPSLLSFRTSRAPDFRFTPGHYARLGLRDEIAAIAHDKLLGASPARLRYVPVVTREPWPGALPVRIPQLIEDGRLERAAGVKLELQHSRIMVCGNPEMSRALRAQLTARGFRTSRRATPGQLAFENYWQIPPPTRLP